MTNFARKLAQLVKTWPGTQRELAEKVGITPQMLYEYLRGSSPRPNVILALARELKVEHAVVWLLDEDDMRIEPPPAPNANIPLEKLSRIDLLMELCRRYVEVAKTENAMLLEAEGTDWEKLASEIIKAGPGKSLDDRQYRLARIAADLAGVHRTNPTDAFDIDQFLSGLVSQESGFTASMMPDAIRKRRALLNANSVVYRIGMYLTSFVIANANPSLENEANKAFLNLDRVIEGTKLER